MHLYRALAFIASIAVLSPAIAQQPKPAQSESTSAAELPNDPMSKMWQADATLRSVAAVSQDRLVAVGDRGTVLLTADGGRTWKLVSIPTSVNLYDIKFEGEIGFLVGGWIGLESGQSYGALLRSHDGGQTWQVVRNDLPRLVGLQIQGGQLLCWGDYSTTHSSSVFHSLDGGVTWTGAVNGLGHATAATINSSGGIAAIDQLGRAKFPQSSSPIALAHPEAHLNALIHVNSHWLAAGEFGGLFKSPDGSNWQNCKIPLAASSQAVCSWNCLQQFGGTLWLAGSPGSLMLRSTNFGESWEAVTTGQNLPLNKVCFVDNSRGWAVGAAGTVLATRDGGQSWYTQRKQGERVSLLTFASNADQPAWLATAACVWDQKKLAATVCLQHAEQIRRASVGSTTENSCVDTARQMGTADFVTLDVSTSSPEIALSRLATQIAIWQPDIILTAVDQRASADEYHPIKAVSKALRVAASSEFQPTLAELNLKPWQASKLVTTTNSGQSEYVEDSQKFIRDIGIAVRDVLGCVPVKQRQNSLQLTLQTSWSKFQSRATQHELFGGVALQSGSSLTSSFQQIGSYQMVMGRFQRERALIQLTSADSVSLAMDTWDNQLRFFLQSVPAREQSEVLMRVVDGLLSSQQWQRADSVLQEAAKNRSDLGLWAASEFLRIATSVEMRDWIGVPVPTKAGPKNSALVYTSSFHDTWSNSPFGASENSAKSTALSPKDQFQDRSNGGRVVTASAERTISGSPFSDNTTADNPTMKLNLSDQPAESTNTAESSSNLSSQSSLSNLSRDSLSMIDAAIRIHPELQSLPATKMMVAAHLRQSQRKDAARALLHEVAEKQHIVGWSTVAQQELAVLDGLESSLKLRASAHRTNELPKLDGQLSEPMWLRAEPMRLDSLSQQLESPSDIRFCYDDEYLYLAISCPKSANQLAVAPSKNRGYDADLRSFDRVEISLDIDRDYCTAIELTVAENGLTADRCCGNSSYNPKWYVEVQSRQDAWQAEVAIRLDQLTSTLPTNKTRWAISARRTRASGALQSWPQLKTHLKLPEASGLLIFE